MKVVICNLTTKEIFDTYFVLKQFFEKLSDASYFDNSVEQNSRIRAQYSLQLQQRDDNH